MALWVLRYPNGLHHVNLDVSRAPQRKDNIFGIFEVRHANWGWTKYGVYKRYRSNGFLCFRGIKIGGWRRYSLMSSKAFWHSSFHSWGSFFLRSLKVGSQAEVSLAMNRLMYCNWPKNPLISFSLLGGGISNMALIFDGSTSIPLSLTKNPNNFLAVTPKVHFYGFNLNLYFLILSNNFLKLMIWPSLSLDFIIISSTNTSTSLCIIWCNRVMAILW